MTKKTLQKVADLVQRYMNTMLFAMLYKKLFCF